MLFTNFKVDFLRTQKSQRNIFNSMKTAIFILAFSVELALVRGLYFTSRLQGKSQPSSVA